MVFRGNLHVKMDNDNNCIIVGDIIDLRSGDCDFDGGGAAVCAGSCYGRDGFLRDVGGCAGWNRQPEIANLDGGRRWDIAGNRRAGESCRRYRGRECENYVGSGRGRGKLPVCAYRVSAAVLRPLRCPDTEFVHENPSGGTHHYTIRAKIGDSYGAYPEWVSGEVVGVAPGPPENLQVIIRPDGKVEFTWEAPATGSPDGCNFYLADVETGQPAVGGQRLVHRHEFRAGVFVLFSVVAINDVEERTEACEPVGIDVECKINNALNFMVSPICIFCFIKFYSQTLSP